MNRTQDATPSGEDRVARGGWTMADWAVGALLAGAAAFICVMAILRRPDLNSSGTFLFSDPGVNLLLAQKLTEGARLYRDAGFSYGPLAIVPYAWFTKIAGNTPQAYSSFLALFSVVSVFLAYRLLRGHVSILVATVTVVFGLFPTILLPGSLVFGVQASVYFVLERVGFIGVLFLWRPPQARVTRNAALVGLTLGVWQGLRFGTAIFLGIALVLVDLLALWVARADRAALTRWLRLSFVTLGCFLAVEAMWALWAFALLPAADARDFLWPSYVLDVFKVWPVERRWPRYESARLFVGQQLIALGAATLGAVVLYRVIRMRMRDGAVGRATGWGRLSHTNLVLMIPFAFFVIGAAGLFQSVYHFHQYAWTLPLAAALALEYGGRRFAAAFLLASVPAVALMLRANLLTSPPAGTLRVRFPHGTLALTPEENRRVEQLRAYAANGAPRTLIIMRVGAGFHALMGTPFNGRQSFYILGFARGDDAAVMLRTLASQPSAIVLTDFPVGQTPGADPCTWYGWPHFTRDVCDRLPQHVDLAGAIRVDATTWILPGVTQRSP